MKKHLSSLFSTLQGGARGGLLILVLMATTALWAQRFQSGDLYYYITSSSAPYTVEVEDAVSSITSATIPETVKNNGTTYSVTSIGGYAFYGCSSLTSITIPNSVTSIGHWAFYGCSSLTSITIPEGVTSIGYRAFYGCSSLTSITIPNNVTSIGNHAFYYCSSLTSITIPEGVTSIGGGAFACCSSLKSVTIPNSVTSIGDNAFYSCSSLTSITIPEGVTSIGIYAFYYCSSLTSITIPEGVTSIGKSAFYGCSSLTSITIPEGVTSIGYWAFYGCSSLTSITIPNNVMSIGDLAFYKTGIYNDESNWENGVLYISNCLIEAKADITGAYSIKDCTRLIADYAFYGCRSLTSITIPNSVTSVGKSAFAYCSSLDTITCYASIPPSVDGTSSFQHYNATLYVPCEALTDYQAHEIWGLFADIQCISSEEVEGTEDVVIDAGSTTVVITWPTEEGADTYTIVITKDGEVVCTLTFNSDGQLLNIAFMPGREGNHAAQFAEAVSHGSGTGYRFTVTGLEQATHYAYNISAKDAANNTVATHTGEFTTKSLTAIENIDASGKADVQKILHNGQLLILKDGKTYNIMGAEIR